MKAAIYDINKLNRITLQAMCSPQKWLMEASRSKSFLLSHNLSLSYKKSIVGLSNTIGSAWSYLRIKSLLRELLHQKNTIFHNLLILKLFWTHII